jgi:hypothetical protein
LRLLFSQPYLFCWLYALSTSLISGSRPPYGKMLKYQSELAAFDCWDALVPSEPDGEQPYVEFSVEHFGEHFGPKQDLKN